MGKTQRFGLDYFGGTEPGSIEDNGGKFTDRDRRLLDRVLAALEVHDHGNPASRLADPAQAPTLTLDSTGGELPSGETYYYRVSYVDDNGLETAAGDEVSIATPAVIAIPETPGLNAESGGTLGQGLHQYAVSAISAAGQETPLSAPALITLTDWRSVTITWVVPTDAASIGVWRQGPLDGGYTKIATVAAPATTFLDDGSVPSISDPCAPENLPPDDNLTNATNAITIGLPAEAVGNEAISAWRIYRTTESGVYEPSSMVAEVVETTDELGGTLATTYVDTGDLPQPGQPLDVGQTLQGASQLTFPTGAALPDPAGLPQGYPFLQDDGTLSAVLSGAFQAIGGGGGGGGGRATYTEPWADHVLADYTGTQLLAFYPGADASLTLPAVANNTDPIVVHMSGGQLTLVPNGTDYIYGPTIVGDLQTVIMWPSHDRNGAAMWFRWGLAPQGEMFHGLGTASAVPVNTPTNLSFVLNNRKGGTWYDGANLDRLVVPYAPGLYAIDMAVAWSAPDVQTEATIRLEEVNSGTPTVLKTQTVDLPAGLRTSQAVRTVQNLRQPASVTRHYRIVVVQTAAASVDVTADVSIEMRG